MTAPELPGEPDLVAEFTSETDSSATTRRRQARAFFARFGDPADWQRASLVDQLAAEPECGRFVAWLIVTGRVRPSPDYLLGCRGNLASIGDRVHAALSIEFADMSKELGYSVVLARRQWSALLLIAALTATAANRVGDAQIDDAVQQLRSAADRAGNRSLRNLTANVFGMQAVLFHLGLIDRLPTRSNGRVGRRDAQWRHITEHAPLLAITLRDYLDQMGVRLRPNSIASVEKSLRIFAGYLIEHHPDIRCVADVRRNHVQAYKTWLATRTGNRGPSLANQTIRTRLGTLAAFFARLDELDIADRPPRVPVLRSDLPIKDDPLPRFIDDAASAKLLTAVRAHPDPFTRTAIELLARTGMRQGELLALTTDAVVQIGSSYWLRVPLGKLHTDRYIPLHPHLKTLLDDWMTQRGDIARSKLLFLERGRRIRPSRLATALHSVAAEAGIGHVTPHQLRHTLATQAINRGMSLEAIAALLGHKSMSMTLVYARIADRTVADEYFAVTQKVEALYDQHRQLPADAEGSEMAKLRREAHRRMLGNGYCARPVELDCHFESICESCTFFVTTIEFRPTLQRQRDDAAAKGQVGRQKIFDGLLDRLDGDAAS
ncbi:tyrosine-type recombinase/integrase [Rhodococcus sp. T7]|uniref:tyrosine-type recombinase/integrase n=1 Tax=Rhodococcus sp. T7 TaxID=627444 RepID=UPI0013CBDD15|nr:tyrosine-type recombinase/integrase [Rhodococcus sp. T7]KAF0957016.1 Tyrosine recombinase XerC [Rhodococcus sp. T7]KAF0963229.1 Tyrosine recombinase XerC [Rhodococcus sp. T7]